MGGRWKVAGFMTSGTITDRNTIVSTTSSMDGLVEKATQRTLNHILKALNARNLTLVRHEFVHFVQPKQRMDKTIHI